MYGCDCYAYGLLAVGLLDLVAEADLKPYDYMAVVPIVEVSVVCWAHDHHALGRCARRHRSDALQYRSVTDVDSRAASRAVRLLCLLQGAGGVITDWEGNALRWSPRQGGSFPGEVLAAGDEAAHKQALDLLRA